MGDRVHLSLDDDAQATMEELEDEIENIYGSKSAFFKQKLMEYDRKSKMKAKVDLIDTRIQALQDEIEDLKLQKEGLQNRIEDMSAEEQVTTSDSSSVDDEEYWQKTMNLIAKRKDRKDPKDVKKRFDKYFEHRFSLYKNRFDVDIGMQDFRERLVNEMRERGFDDKAEVIA